MSEDKVPIYISKKLYNEIKKRVEENQDAFKNVEEFIEFVLNEVVKEEDEEVSYSPEEEEEIKRRLRSLGYL